MPGRRRASWSREPSPAWRPSPLPGGGNHFPDPARARRDAPPDDRGTALARAFGFAFPVSTSRRVPQPHGVGAASGPRDRCQRRQLRDVVTARMPGRSRLPRDQGTRPVARRADIHVVTSFSECLICYCGGDPGPKRHGLLPWLRRLFGSRPPETYATTATRRGLHPPTSKSYTNAEASD